MKNGADIEVYQEAIKKATQSKAFDRILHMSTVIVFLIVATFVIVQQASYQSGIGRVTEERNRQYQELKMSQEAVRKEAAGIKDYIACLKRLPVQPDEASITICKEKINGENQNVQSKHE